MQSEVAAAVAEVEVVMEVEREEAEVAVLAVTSTPAMFSLFAVSAGSVCLNMGQFLFLPTKGQDVHILKSTQLMVMSMHMACTTSLHGTHVSSLWLHIKGVCT